METKQQRLTVWPLVMLALGSVVGGSFFLGTAVTLRTAGLGSLVAFAVGGVVIYIILMALSEMTVSRPVHGSFRTYAEMAFGPMASFVVGWLYWTGLVLALSSEATATALFARTFISGVPIWLLSLAVIMLVTALNLMDVSFFSRVESAMAAAKLLSVIGFILVAGVAITVGVRGASPIVAGMIRGAVWLPSGVGGLAGSLLVVLFTYAGFEVLGLAAPDAQEPDKTVPRAVLLTVTSLVSLYMLAIAAILPILPIANLHEDVSPFVVALRAIGMPTAAAVLNVIVMTAAVSTMLAAMYGLSRMLQSLAQDGHAPALFKQVTAAGGPRNALLASAGGMLVGVVLARVLPQQVYLFLVSSAGFALLFSYLMILLSHYVLRRQEGCPATGCQLPLFPYSSWLGIGLLLVTIVSMPLVRGQGAGLVAGLGLLAFFSLAYLLRQRTGRRPPTPEGEERLLLH